MALSATTNANASTNMKKCFELTKTATTDGTASSTLTIAHGFAAAQRVSAASDGTNRIMLSWEPMLPAGAISGWYVVAMDNTNLTLSTPGQVAASSDAGASMRLLAWVQHSLVE